MFLTQIHTKFKISVHNSTNSANIKTILNIRHRNPPIYSKECKYQSYIKHNIYYHALVVVRNG